MKIETLQFQPRAAVAPTDDLAVKLAAAEDAIYRLYKEGPFSMGTVVEKIVR